MAWEWPAIQPQEARKGPDCAPISDLHGVSLAAAAAAGTAPRDIIIAGGITACMSDGDTGRMLSGCPGLQLTGFQAAC